MDKLDVADVAEKLNEVNLGPTDRANDDLRAGRAEAALGHRCTSLVGQPMKLLELAPLFQPQGKPRHVGSAICKLSCWQRDLRRANSSLAPRRCVGCDLLAATVFVLS